MTATATWTPWGIAQKVEERAVGITFYTTPSHGGFGLSDERWTEFQQALSGFNTFAGGPWFEEDGDWAAVVLVFAEHFSDQEVWDSVRAAYRRADLHFGGAKWNRVVNWLETHPKGKQCVKRASVFAKSLEGMYERGSNGTTRTRGWWWVVMRPAVGPGDAVECYMTLEQMHAKRFFTPEEVEACRCDRFTPEPIPR